MKRVGAYIAALAVLRMWGQLSNASATDCNHNGIDDAEELRFGWTIDANHNGIPDDCEQMGPDCNTNHIRDPDEPEYVDCDGNGVFDVCDPDCDSNGTPDTCDLARGAPDCNANQTLDACEGFGSVQVFNSDVAGWRLAAGQTQAHAIDYYFPGRYEGRGELSPPDATMRLPGVDVTIEDTSGVCAILDGASVPAVSDAAMFAGYISRWTFSRPVYAFYTYYGSQGAAVTATLYSGSCPVATIGRYTSDHPFWARGQGFVSGVGITRIDFQTPELALVGAFVGLAAGEPSLGTLYMPDYHSPVYQTVDLDFALSTTPPQRSGDVNCDGVSNADDIPPFISALLGTGLPQSCGISAADMNSDGVIDGADVQRFIEAIMPPP